MTVKVKFEGIDSWNRPVFKSLLSKSRYGSVDILFDYNTTELKVLEKINEDNLLFFGDSFGCEPMGDTVTNLEIVRPEPEQRIYIKSAVDGKMIAITAIFTRVHRANEYLEIHPEEGVIYEFGGLVFVADNNDLGY